jgi:AraC-like DNA-binding protein
MPSVISVTERTYTPETLVHRHPFAQVVLPDRGRLDLVIEGQRGAVAGTGYAVVTPETEHICWAEQPTRCLVVDLQLPLLAEASASGGSGWTDSGFRPFDARVRALTHLLRVETAAGGLEDPLVAEALGRYAANAFAAPEPPPSRPVMKGPGGRLLARRVRAYLDEHYREELPLTAVADSMGASIAHVQRSFRAETGATVVAYIQGRRLDAASELLRTTDLSVTEIAIKTGFGSASYFARLFARRYGAVPSQYRASAWSESDALLS